MRLGAVSRLVVVSVRGEDSGALKTSVGGSRDDRQSALLVFVRA
jgi:hypothetical protein